MVSFSTFADWLIRHRLKVKVSSYLLRKIAHDLEFSSIKSVDTNDRSNIFVDTYAIP